MPVLSWRQMAVLLEFGVSGIAAKLDTGAWGTALHATGIEVRGDRVAFTLHSSPDPLRAGSGCEAPLADLRRVTSSNGVGEERPFIRTLLALGDLKPRIVEISLTARPGMRFPLLVGRAALEAWEVLVDPGEPRPGSCNKVRP